MTSVAKFSFRFKTEEAKSKASKMSADTHCCTQKPFQQYVVAVETYLLRYEIGKSGDKKPRHLEMPEVRCIWFLLNSTELKSGLMSPSDPEGS